MYYMEVALGQFSQLGPVAVWKMVPIGRGIGFAMCTLCIIGRNTQDTRQEIICSV